MYKRSRKKKHWHQVRTCCNRVFYDCHGSGGLSILGYLTKLALWFRREQQSFHSRMLSCSIELRAAVDLSGLSSIDDLDKFSTRHSHEQDIKLSKSRNLPILFPGDTNDQNNPHIAVCFLRSEPRTWHRSGFVGKNELRRQMNSVVKNTKSGLGKMYVTTSGAIFLNSLSTWPYHPERLGFSNPYSLLESACQTYRSLWLLDFECLLTYRNSPI